MSLTLWWGFECQVSPSVTVSKWSCSMCDNFMMIQSALPYIFQYITSGYG